MRDLKAKILSNKEIAPGYFKMALDGPYIATKARPGQFVQVRCGNETEPLLRRPLGIHRVTGKVFEVLYEVVGKGTALLSGKRPGELVDILGPLGNGFELSRQAILVAGGIGVAPLVFLAEGLAKKKTKPIILIGAKTKKMILCEKDFKKLGAEVYTTTDDGSCGCKGFAPQLFQTILQGMEDKQRPTVYACGPQAMLKCIADICKKEKIRCQLSLEENMACGIGACLGCAVKVEGGIKMACKDGPIFDAEDLIWE